MRDILSKLCYLVALVASLTLVALAVGGALVDLPDPDPGALERMLREGGTRGIGVAALTAHRTLHPAPPGLGLPSLALVDIGWLVTIVILGLEAFLPRPTDPEHPRSALYTGAQALTRLLAGVAQIVTSIMVAVTASTLLMTMISLLTALPFGTLVYIAIWGTFDRETAETLLGAALVARVVAAAAILCHRPSARLLRHLLPLFVSGVGCAALLSFLHGAVPMLLVSLLDALAAVIIAIVGLVWGVVFAWRGLDGTLKWARSGAPDL